VQAILACQTKGSLDLASHLADRICEVTPLPTTASVSRSTPDSTAGLLELIEELTRQVASLRASHHGSRSQSRDHHRLQSSDRRRNTPNYPSTPHDTRLVPLEIWGRTPKVHPTVLPPAEGLPPRERDSRQQENFNQRTLTAANVCTTSSGRLFISDRITKQRYLVDTGSDLCVFPRKLLLGRRERTDYTLYGPMGPSSPHMDGPHGA
jgi:hypothetical protein